MLPYAESFIAIPQDLLVWAGIHSIDAFAALFLVVVCGNVALLMFARAATREREILVRRALGAVRSRIVMQLFAEGLVLAAIAAVLGLAATDFALKWALAAMSTAEEAWPFWFEGGLSATTLTYSAWLTVLAAVVAGVVPALKVTRTNMEVGLRQAGAGAGGIRMGGIWTAVIVAQIAATVLFTAVAYVVQRQAAGIASAKAAFPAEEYLAVRLEMDRDDLMDESASTLEESFLRRREATARELEQRVAADARVAGVTLAERLPLMPSDGGAIELDDAGPSVPVTGRGFFVATTAVDLDFFEVFQTPFLAGRGVWHQVAHHADDFKPRSRLLDALRILHPVTDAADGGVWPRLYRAASAGIPGGVDRCTEGRWIAVSRIFELEPDGRVAAAAWLRGVA